MCDLSVKTSSFKCSNSNWDIKIKNLTLSAVKTKYYIRLYHSPWYINFYQLIIFFLLLKYRHFFKTVKFKSYINIILVINMCFISMPNFWWVTRKNQNLTYRKFFFEPMRAKYVILSVFFHRRDHKKFWDEVNEKFQDFDRTSMKTILKCNKPHNYYSSHY